MRDPRSDVDDEALKPFARPQKSEALDADQKNRFQKHDEARRKELADTSAHEARIAEQERQRATWTHQATEPTTASGVRLDPETARLKAASDASRTAVRQPAPGPVTIDLTTLAAVVKFWREETESGRFFPDLPFNGQSLNNALQTLLARGEPISVATVERAYQWCVEQNCIDDARLDDDGNLVRRRGQFPPPSLFPHYAWPDEEAQEAVTTCIVDGLVVRPVTAETLAEDAANKAKPFDQLQKEARAGFRSPRREEIV